MSDRRSSSGAKPAPQPLPEVAAGPAPRILLGDTAPDVKPSLRRLSTEVGVPFETWAAKENGHRVVTRAEYLGVLRAFIGPMQAAIVAQHGNIRRLAEELQRPWYVRLWRWFLRPLQPAPHSPSPAAGGDTQTAGRSRPRTPANGVPLSEALNRSEGPRPRPGPAVPPTRKG